MTAHLARKAAQILMDRAINPVLRPLGVSLRRTTRHGTYLFYPSPHSPAPRWEHQPDGHHVALKRLIEAGESRYVSNFDRILERAAELRDIPLRQDAAHSARPAWINGWFPALDAAALHTIIAERRPRRYVEVGSGNSTKFARRAIDMHGKSTRLTSIDPQPRAEIDALCDDVVRQPLESVALDYVAGLEAGDILFIDSSHRSFMNSDVTVLFLDILPRLKKGVLIHLHDIYLPADYPRRLGTGHFYNEQYVLAAYLLGGSQHAETFLPNFWITTSPRMRERRERLWHALGLTAGFPADHLGGGSFWMEITRDPE